MVLLSEADKTIHFVCGYITGHGGTGSHNKDSHQPVSGLWLTEGGAACVTTLHPASTPYTMLHLHTTCLHLQSAFCCRRKLFQSHYWTSAESSSHDHGMRSKWSARCPPTHHHTQDSMHISSWIRFTFHDVISANRKSILNSKCWTLSHVSWKVAIKHQKKINCLKLFAAIYSAKSIAWLPPASTLNYTGNWLWLECWWVVCCATTVITIF